MVLGFVMRQAYGWAGGVATHGKIHGLPQREATVTPEGFQRLSATEAARRVRRAEVSSLELVEASVACIEAVNPRLNAVVTTAFDRARLEAAAADASAARGDDVGPLHGVPVAIKDNQRTAGIRTTLGSPLYRDEVPEADAGIVARIRGAGGIVMGKTNIPEFSIGANTVNRLFGATRNPFDEELTCGGSSGGSAVAVASGMVPVATGSDHGGSLRIPASYCGVVGYRASPGVVPNEERTTTQTHYSLQGPIARCVADVGLMLSVIAERTATSGLDPMAFPLDSARFAALDEVDLSRQRVAVSADLGGVLVSNAVRQIFEERVSAMAPFFAALEPHAIDLTSAPDIDWHLRQDVFVSQYLDMADAWDDDVNPNVLATWNAALTTSMRDIAAARRRQVELYREFTAIFEHYDVLILPGVSVQPFPWRDGNPGEIDGVAVDNYMAWLALTAALTVIGHPVVSLPCGLDHQGTPFGIQVVGRMYGDHALLSTAQAIESAFSTVDALRRPVPS
jgi:Asp-tRNA(Asn)/Glu-tRNA(Gln) amidotransferase A subunit family amidase